MRKIILIILSFLCFCIITSASENQVSPQKSDVYLQGFYWNSLPGGIWWDSLATLAPRIASAGFGAVWFPSPVKGAGGGYSMGYDPYDHYDFGEYYQKGSRETRFGSRNELLHAIHEFHSFGIEVYADAVMNHMNGGERRIPYECKPYASFPDSAWLLYEYPNGSGRFKKDASCFYPNSQTCDVNPPYHGADDPLFAFGDWLAHDRDFVRDSLVVWGQYLKQVIGFDGFRLDAVKGIDPAFMGYWLQQVNGDNFAVAEYYSGIDEIKGWFDACQNIYGGNVAMFDFPLRFVLQDMCQSDGGFDMTILDGAGLVNSGMSGYDVSTFVENHDFDRIGWDDSVDVGHNPIYKDKHLAYAYILFSEGRPCVFFKDYFEYGYNGLIDTLIWIRQQYLGGGTTGRAGLNVWYIRQDGSEDQEAIAPDIYVARRDGYGDQSGGYLVINDHPDQWIDIWVDTEMPEGTVYRDFTGKDNPKTVQLPFNGKNRVKLWAPPRSFTIYVADTTSRINHPPLLSEIPDLTAYTNSLLTYKLNVADVDNDGLTFNIKEGPEWLSVNICGVLSGRPAMTDVGSDSVIVVVTDPPGISVADTFIIDVLENYPPELLALNDTTVKATKRFERQLQASDPEDDTLHFYILQAPGWLNLDQINGLLSATPALTDTGVYPVYVSVTDGKGAFDTTAFQLTVIENFDTLIATYAKPHIDGTVQIGDMDWQTEWCRATDDSSDSFWSSGAPPDNELYAFYCTWDADTLYLGIDYLLNDVNNTLMIYLDAGIDSGITNFNSDSGYLGDYPKNNCFRKQNAIDCFFPAYRYEAPGFFKVTGNLSLNLTESINSQRGKNGTDAEIAVAWHDIYELGAGLLKPGAELNFVLLIAGGHNWGSGDALPDNPDVDGDSGPDSLISFITVLPDQDGDGIPDPTVFIRLATDPVIAVPVPEQHRLAGNFPNPFNPETTIAYYLAFDSNVEIHIFDITGRRVETLINGEQKAGIYRVIWNAENYPSGLYFVQFNAGSFRDTRKMMLLK